MVTVLTEALCLIEALWSLFSRSLMVPILIEASCSLKGCHFGSSKGWLGCVGNQGGGNLH